MPYEHLQKLQSINATREVMQLAPSTMPCMASVKSQVQEVYDQGSEGSCTANAYCGAYRMLQDDKSFLPSRQYVYAKTRLLENGNNPDRLSDTGANVEDAVRWVSEHGVCSESLWPYVKDTVNIDPPDYCDVEASLHKLGTLKAVQVGDAATVKQLLQSGTPIMIAIAVYESFGSPITSKFGIVKMPNPVKYGDANDAQDKVVGGHEVLIVGYHDFPGYFTFVNSWGTDWGNKGYGYLPYSYFNNTQLTWQLCCITK